MTWRAGRAAYLTMSLRLMKAWHPLASNRSPVTAALFIGLEMRHCCLSVSHCQTGWWVGHVSQWLLRRWGNIQQDGTKHAQSTRDSRCLFWASWRGSLHPQDVACNTAALCWRVSDSERKNRKKAVSEAQLRWWILLLILPGTIQYSSGHLNSQGAVSNGSRFNTEYIFPPKYCSAMNYLCITLTLSYSSVNVLMCFPF